MSENRVIDPMVRELMETAAIGEAARLFLQSDLGKYVTSRAAEEIDEAMLALCDVDPTHDRTIADLQAKINVAKNCILYLTDAMTQGEHAMRQLEDDS